jgi:hypothetical protein
MEWDKGSCGPAPDTRGLKTDHGARLATRRRHIVRARPAKGARKPPKPNHPQRDHWRYCRCGDGAICHVWAEPLKNGWPVRQQLGRARRWTATAKSSSKTSKDDGGSGGRESRTKPWLDKAASLLRRMRTLRDRSPRGAWRATRGRAVHQPDRRRCLHLPNSSLRALTRGCRWTRTS